MMGFGFMISSGLDTPCEAIPGNSLISFKSRSSTGRGSINMDKTGVGSLIAGIVLVILGIYGVWVYVPEVISFLKGVIGILGIVIGIFLLIFGAILIKD